MGIEHIPLGCEAFANGAIIGVLTTILRGGEREHEGGSLLILLLTHEGTAVR